MKIKRIEITVIIITLAFACFTAGYFTGRRAVNIISIQPDSRFMVTSSSNGDAQLPANETGINENSGEADGEKPTVEDLDKININEATREELTSLPGIGDTLAERIIEFREQYNGFVGISEIMQVEGIGEKKFDAIKDYIYVD